MHGPTRYGTCYSQCDAANKLQTLDYTGTGFFAQWVIYCFNNITGITIQMLKTTDAALRQRKKKKVHCAQTRERLTFHLNKVHFMLHKCSSRLAMQSSSMWALSHWLLHNFHWHISQSNTFKKHRFACCSWKSNQVITLTRHL